MGDSEDVKDSQVFFSLFLRVCWNAMEDVCHMSRINMRSNVSVSPRIKWWQWTYHMGAHIFLVCSHCCVSAIIRRA